MKLLTSSTRLAGPNGGDVGDHLIELCHQMGQNGLDVKVRHVRPDVAEARDLGKCDEEVRIYAMCFGLGVTRPLQRPRTTVYHFWPQTHSLRFGPYCICLAEEEGHYARRITSIQFPKPSRFEPTETMVPLESARQTTAFLPILQDLEARHLLPGTEHGVAAFLSQVTGLLQCYVSRLHQATVTSDTIFKDGGSISFSPDLCSVGMSLIVDDSDTPNPVKIKISMTYDVWSDRPRPDSLIVQVEGRQRDTYSADDLDMIRQQCRVFCFLDMDKAIVEAFS